MTGAIPSRLLRIFSSYFVLARIVRDYFLTSSRGRVVFCNTARVSWLLLLYRVQRPWRIHMHVSPTQAHTQTFSPTRTYTYPHARTLHTHTRQNLHTPNTHTHTHTHANEHTHTHAHTHTQMHTHAKKTQIQAHLQVHTHKHAHRSCDGSVHTVRNKALFRAGRAASTWKLWGSYGCSLKGKDYAGGGTCMFVFACVCVC